MPTKFGRHNEEEPDGARHWLDRPLSLASLGEQTTGRSPVNSLGPHCEPSAWFGPLQRGMAALILRHAKVIVGSWSRYPEQGCA